MMAEHTPCNCLPPWTECKECGEPWPCRDAQIADLQRQLQQAQEERDREAVAVDRLETALIDVNLDKDAAIKRDEAAERRMDGWAIAMRQANHIAVGLRHDYESACVHSRRHAAQLQKAQKEED